MGIVLGVFHALDCACCSGGSFPLTGLANPLTPASGVAGGGQDPRRKSPADFLGENAGLVNLDNLVTKPAANAGEGVGRWRSVSRGVDGGGAKLSRGSRGC